MRYKNNVLDKLSRLDAIAIQLNLQINKNMTQDQLLASIDTLKNAIEDVRELVSLEQDEFEQQFRPR